MADGLVECLPIPEVAGVPSLSSGGTSTASASAGAHFAAFSSAKPAIVPEAKPLQQAGQIYRVGVFEDATSTNFFAANGPDNTVWNSYMLAPTLSVYGLSEKYFTFVPNLAADAVPTPLSEEGDMWVTEVALRQDVTWSDGEPVTANDVAFTANAVLGAGLISGNWGSWYDGGFLDHVEAVDDYTAKYFYHTKPGLARFEYGTLQAPIVAEHYWAPVFEEAMAPITALATDASEEDKTAAQAEAQDILFAHVPDGEPLAGSFLFDRWEQGAFLENSSNPNYFQSGLVIEQWPNAAYQDSEGLTVGTPEGEVETTINVGPHAEAVVYTIYGSQDAAILALQNGEVDFVINPLGLQRGLANRITTDPNLNVIENNVNGYRYLSFNTRRRPMNDCAFRQAVAVLIDKEFVTGTVLQGVAFPNYGFVPPGNAFWFNADIPELGKELDREQRTKLAVAILEQAGYSWEGDQKPAWDPDNLQVTPAGRLLMPDGTPVPSLIMPAPSPGYDPLRSTFAIWIETWLNEFGIPLEAQLAGFNVIVPIIFTEQNFDMYILGWSLGIFPDYLRDFFAEEQAAADGNNAGGYVNPEVEARLSEILTCETFESCKVIADELQVILATELPYVLLFDTGIIEAYRSASVEYPFTEALSGLQYSHQGGGGLQAEVSIK
jgi:ABC-type transport system substrate-binding protein